MEIKSIVCIDKNSCMGCGVCAEKCPKNCIAMQPDMEGFLVPTIDEEVCTNCGICLKFCPTTDVASKLYYKSDRKYFCGIISDKATLLKSSSGGIFGVLANFIIENNGYVCGCVYNGQMEAVHIIVNHAHDIEAMFGSKYVQSRSEQCYAKIKELLEDERTVLFTGTACQVAALRIYLEKDYDALYCVEILCHGVPSPGLFSKYVSYLENKLKGKVESVQFRNKETKGWGSEHRTCIVYCKNREKKKYRPILPAYYSAFFYGLNLRESCYQCRFAIPERIADLTVGDFWGSWSKYGKRFNEGISVVGVNSCKGDVLINFIKDKFGFCENLTEQEAIKSNDNFEHPIKRPVERNSFYNGVQENGYKGLWKKAYLSRTYRKKTLASIYGVFVPAKIRFALQLVRKR